MTKVGVINQAKPSMNWSIAEKEYLREFYKRADIEELCKRLNKNKGEVSEMITEIRREEGWTKEKDDWIVENIELVDVHTMAKRFGCTTYQMMDRLRILKQQGRIEEEDQFDDTSVDHKSRPKLKNDMYFDEYYYDWMYRYKEGTVAEVTFKKYVMTHKWVSRIGRHLTIGTITRDQYQEMMNEYGKYHEKQTTIDFHNQVKACINDALHEGDCPKNPCYKISITGKKSKARKEKFLSLDDFKKVLNLLDLTSINLDWSIYIAALTGMRFGEILGLTPKDFDYKSNCITVNKTWDYKTNKGFKKTKTERSNRTIGINKWVMRELQHMLMNYPQEEPIFIKKVNGEYQKVHNSTVNHRLDKLCTKARVDVISFHSLRHTHASMLLSKGVSVQTISKRLGHSKTSITQDVYLHVTKELESKDNKTIADQLSEIVL